MSSADPASEITLNSYSKIALFLMGPIRSLGARGIYWAVKVIPFQVNDSKRKIPHLFQRPSDRSVVPPQSAYVLSIFQTSIALARHIRGSWPVGLGKRDKVRREPQANQSIVIIPNSTWITASVGLRESMSPQLGMLAEFPKMQE